MPARQIVFWCFVAVALFFGIRVVELVFEKPEPPSQSARYQWSKSKGPP